MKSAEVSALKSHDYNSDDNSKEAQQGRCREAHSSSCVLFGSLLQEWSTYMYNNALLLKFNSVIIKMQGMRVHTWVQIFFMFRH